MPNCSCLCWYAGTPMWIFHVAENLKLAGSYDTIMLSMQSLEKCVVRSDTVSISCYFHSYFAGATEYTNSHKSIKQHAKTVFGFLKSNQIMMPKPENRFKVIKLHQLPAGRHSVECYARQRKDFPTPHPSYLKSNKWESHLGYSWMIYARMRSSNTHSISCIL